MAALVDSHVHLDRYADDAVRAMLARAGAAGVTRLLTVGVDPASSAAALRLAGRYPAVLAAVGIHPTRLARVAAEGPPERALRALLAGAGPPGRGGAAAARGSLSGRMASGPADAAPVARPVAVGEVGLDDAAPDPAAQLRFLDAALAIAAEHDLPLVLHVVGRPATHAVALERVARAPGARVVAHYFVGGPELARRYLERGCWLAVGKPVTRPGQAVREAVAVVPPERLLLETDTYPLPGRATEPRDVALVCTAVAELTGRSYAEVVAATTASFDALLGH